ncbi:inovirus-type Gp2 protein [Vibrio sp. 1288]|uniref:YagK/YfjJ domain-containing protein n=1 Tax=Vibrio sp. 1288 TaxID=3074550 RepID=UPI0029662D59|nr:inovirus-type Gp2 protein [Vibrio sp. 1288]MDW3136308.1 inovirus-type Gp2 protein [Vibrio sp. 1288]
MSIPIYQGEKYLGLPVNCKHELHESYLAATHRVLLTALSHHPRSILFHVILRYPQNWLSGSEGSITRFLKAFKAKVHADQQRRIRWGKNCHLTRVNYIWCRESSTELKEHYHVFILLNRDSYRKLGHPSGHRIGELTWMISSAWAGAIGLNHTDVAGLIEFKHPKSIIVKDIPGSIKEEYDDVLRDSFESAFHWMSYACKLTTKEYGNGVRHFGSSQ